MMVCDAYFSKSGILMKEVYNFILLLLFYHFV